MKKKCICQICTCGRHRCPHEGSSPNRIINKSNQDRCHVNSEYKTNYLPGQRTRGPFLRPTDKIHSEGDVGTDTTQKLDFVAFQVTPPKQKEPEKYVPNKNPFQTVSEHRDHYRGTRTMPAKIPPYLRGETMRAPSAKVVYKSISHDDYKGWSSQPQRVIRVTASNSYAPPAEPFRETSIHRQDFLRFNQPPRPTARQPDKIKYDGPVANSTNYRTEFNSKEIPPRYQRKQEERVPPEEPFNSNSVFKEDFVDLRGAPKAPMYNPKSDLFKTDKPMEQTTTKTDDYKTWEISPRKQVEPVKYKSPDGAMDCQTTHMDYAHFGKKAVPAKTARPRTKLRFGREDALDDKTNYGLSFKWFYEPVVHSKGPKIRNEIFPPVQERSPEKSEFLDKYKRFNVVPPKMFRDRSTLFKTSEGIAKDTVYDDDYTWPRITCPASETLIKGTGTLVFDHETETGHKMFAITENAHNHTDIAVT